MTRTIFIGKYRDGKWTLQDSDWIAIAKNHLRLEIAVRARFLVKSRRAVGKLLDGAERQMAQKKLDDEQREYDLVVKRYESRKSKDKMPLAGDLCKEALNGRVLILKISKTVNAYYANDAITAKAPPVHETKQFTTDLCKAAKKLVDVYDRQCDAGAKSAARAGIDAALSEAHERIERYFERAFDGQQAVPSISLRDIVQNLRLIDPTSVIGDIEDEEYYTPGAARDRWYNDLRKVFTDNGLHASAPDSGSEFVAFVGALHNGLLMAPEKPMSVRALARAISRATEDARQKDAKRGRIEERDAKKFRAKRTELIELGREHWRAHRPLLFKRFAEAGTLDAKLTRAAERAIEDCEMLKRHGIADDEAWKLALDEFLLIDDESDLGAKGH